MNFNKKTVKNVLNSSRIKILVIMAVVAAFSVLVFDTENHHTEMVSQKRISIQLVRNSIHSAQCGEELCTENETGPAAASTHQIINICQNLWLSQQHANIFMERIAKGEDMKAVKYTTMRTTSPKELCCSSASKIS